jgi:hypothetical protein
MIANDNAARRGHRKASASAICTTQARMAATSRSSPGHRTRPVREFRHVVRPALELVRQHDQRVHVAVAATPRLPSHSSGPRQFRRRLFAPPVCPAVPDRRCDRSPVGLLPPHCPLQPQPIAIPRRSSTLQRGISSLILPMASPGGVVIGDHGQSSPFWCRNSLLDWGENVVQSCGGP